LREGVGLSKKQLLEGVGEGKSGKVGKGPYTSICTESRRDNGIFEFKSIKKEPQLKNGGVFLSPTGGGKLNVCKQKKASHLSRSRTMGWGPKKQSEVNEREVRVCPVGIKTIVLQRIENG